MTKETKPEQAKTLIMYLDFNDLIIKTLNFFVFVFYYYSLVFDKNYQKQKLYQSQKNTYHETTKRNKKAAFFPKERFLSQ